MIAELIRQNLSEISKSDWLSDGKIQKAEDKESLVSNKLFL